MRPSVIASLFFVAALGLGTRGLFREAVRPPKLRAEPAASFRGPVLKGQQQPQQAGPPTWTAVVTSDEFANVDDAWSDALVKARSDVNDQLRKMDPPVNWAPSVDFIRQHLVRASKEDSRQPDITGAPMMHRIRLELELNSEGQRLVQSKDREFRIEQRMVLLARWLGGLVLILGAFAGYVRLDDWTKGYLTFPLRVVAVLVAATGAGFLWFGM